MQVKVKGDKEVYEEVYAKRPSSVEYTIKVDVDEIDDLERMERIANDLRALEMKGVTVKDITWIECGEFYDAWGDGIYEIGPGMYLRVNFIKNGWAVDDDDIANELLSIVASSII